MSNEILTYFRNGGRIKMNDNGSTVLLKANDYGTDVGIKYRDGQIILTNNSKILTNSL